MSGGMCGISGRGVVQMGRVNDFRTFTYIALYATPPRLRWLVYNR